MGKGKELIPLSVVYHDPDTGQPISTQSMIKTFRRCPKQAQYKYVDRLKPRALGKPLRQGDWMHHLMETKFKGGDWRDTHAIFTSKFNNLFDEEREAIGDLPSECKRMMQSYEWHYKDETWIVHEVELMLEAELPNGHIFRVKIDLLIEDQFGLWLVDHKFNRQLPNLDMRILDIQSVAYVWAALRMGIPVNGFIWNYVKRKPPTIPQLLKSGERLSARAIETDYPTLARAIKRYGLQRRDYAAWLERLKAQRYQHGMPQRSPFFRRNIIERDNEQLKRIMREMLHTSKRMHEYPFNQTDIVERNVDRSCTFMCSYTDICTLEAFGGDTRNLRKQRFEQVDPMYYYFDDPKEELTRGVE